MQRGGASAASPGAPICATGTPGTPGKPGTLDAAHPPSLRAAMLHLRLPPQGVAVLGVDTAPQGGYTNYKRVQ